MGFFTLLERELYRFIRLARQTLFPPLITTVMFILIFGASLGDRIREIEGFAYIVFILPGLIQMGVVNNAFANTSTSLFVARMERSIENLLVAPLSYFQLVSAYILGGMFRGLIVGGVIMLTSHFLVDGIPYYHWGYILAGLIFPSLLFGALGLMAALWAESWDKIATFTNFIITPFVYLGGVFYSIKMLPDFWYRISLFNPVYHCVDLLRYGFLGVSDTPIWISLVVVTSFSLICFGICIYLFRVGYKLMR